MTTGRHRETPAHRIVTLREAAGNRRVIFYPAGHAAPKY